MLAHTLERLSVRSLFGVGCGGEGVMARMQFIEDGRELFVHLLRPGRTVVGRSDKCDVALPSDSVSRTHFVLERRTEGWWLVDRSRNGTRVNGEPVVRHLMAHGDEIGLGVYTARFTLMDDEEREGTTTVSPMAAAIHEQIVEVSEAGVATCRAELVFTHGPLEGQTALLQRPRTTLGGPGADVVLDPAMPKNGLRIRVVRGRAMLEPAEVPAFLEGMRVRELTPVLPGEEVRIGEHAFAMNARTEAETSEHLTTFGEMVGASPAMRRVFGLLSRVAAHEDPVLLTGESGTGKEVAARALHDCGPRYEGPFVAVNCAAIAEQLFESELFGHERGAFTGATNRQDGAFQQAHGGTLFLDEIGEMRLDLQAKLLRALESGEVRRVGASAPEYPDVRVVAATNRNLPEMVRQGTFRNDLYFRLEVLTVRLPPLRERVEDLPMLARALVSRNHPGAALTEDAVRALQDYEFPGNVRELKNVLTRAFVMGGPVITAESLHFHPWAFDGDPVEPGLREDGLERNQILAALQRHGGNRTRAARDLGIPRSSLLYKIKRHGIILG